MSKRFKSLFLVSGLILSAVNPVALYAEIVTAQAVEPDIKSITIERFDDLILDTISNGVPTISYDTDEPKFKLSCETSEPSNTSCGNGIVFEFYKGDANLNNEPSSLISTSIQDGAISDGKAPKYAGRYVVLARKGIIKSNYFSFAIDANKKPFNLTNENVNLYKGSQGVNLTTILEGDEFLRYTKYLDKTQCHIVSNDPSVQIDNCIISIGSDSHYNESEKILLKSASISLDINQDGKNEIFSKVNVDPSPIQVGLTPAVKIFKKNTWKYGETQNILNGSIQAYPENYHQIPSSSIEYYYYDKNGVKNIIKNEADLGNIVPGKYSIYADLRDDVNGNIKVKPAEITVKKALLGVEKINSEDHPYNNTKEIKNPKPVFSGVQNNDEIKYELSDFSFTNDTDDPFVGRKVFSAKVTLKEDSIEKYVLSVEGEDSIVSHNNEFEVKPAKLNARLKNESDGELQNTTFIVKKDTPITKAVILNRILLPSLQNINYEQLVAFKINNQGDFEKNLNIDTSSSANNSVKIQVKLEGIDMNNDQIPEYKTEDITIYLSVSEKAHISTIAEKGTKTFDKTYDKLAVDPKGALKIVPGFSENDFKLEYYLENKTEKLISAPTKAGKYIASYISKNVEYEGALDIPFEIFKADPTSSLSNKSFAAKIGTKLKDIVLPKDWQWENPDVEIKFKNNTTEESHRAVLDVSDEEKSNYITTEYKVIIKKYIASSTGSSSSSSSSSSEDASINQQNQGLGSIENAPISENAGGLNAPDFSTPSGHYNDGTISSIGNLSQAADSSKKTEEFSVHPKNHANELNNDTNKISEKQYTYKTISGENQKFDPKDEIIFRLDAPFGDFSELYIDDKIVEKNNYIAREGSTIITLSKEYAKTLSNGEHTLRAEFKNGATVIAKFSIEKPGEKGTFWLVISSVVAVVLVAAYVYRKKVILTKED